MRRTVKQDSIQLVNSEHITSFSGVFPFIRYAQGTCAGKMPNLNKSLNQAIILCGNPRIPHNFQPHIFGDRKSIEQTLNRMDGRFSLVAAETDRAIIATDILGCGSVYFGTFKGKVIVGSHVGLIRRQMDALGIAYETNGLGLASAVLGSMCISGFTAIEGLYRLKAGEYAIIDFNLYDQQHISVFQYSTPYNLLETQSNSSSDILEALEESIAEEDDIESLFLSTGRDSFAVGSLLPDDIKDSITAVSYGDEFSADRIGAEFAANMLKMNFRTVLYDAGEVLENAATVAQLTGGVSGLQTTQHLTGAKKASSFVRSAFTGFLGDILSGKPYDKSNNPMETAVRRVMPRRSSLSPNAKRLLKPEIEKIEDILLSMMADAPGTSAEKAIMVDLLYRQAHYIGGTFDLMNQFLSISTPFFSKIVLSAAFSGRYSPAERRQKYIEGLNKRGYGQNSKLQTQSGTSQGLYSTPVDWGKECSLHADSIREWVKMIPDKRWHLVCSELHSNRPGIPIALFALPGFMLPHFTSDPEHHIEQAKSLNRLKSLIKHAFRDFMHMIEEVKKRILKPKR